MSEYYNFTGWNILTAMETLIVGERFQFCHCSIIKNLKGINNLLQIPFALQEFGSRSGQEGRASVYLFAVSLQHL